MSEKKHLLKENWTQWRLKPYLSLNRKMLVLLDWGWKMLNWWIVIPVLAWHLQSAPNLQWRSNCTPAQSNNWTQFFVASIREIMKPRHPALSRKFCTSFCEMEPKQLLLVAGFWGNRFCTVDSKPPLAWTVEQLYSWLPPLAWASWWPVRARMSENRTFSGSRARQQVL